MISLSDYGVYGRFLESYGWRIKPGLVSPGTAQTSARSKTIVVQPRAFDRPDRRVRAYVIPHEIWHALHAEILQWETIELCAARNLDWRGAVEAVADAGCLSQSKTRLMRAWVKLSVAWHGKKSLGRYTMADVLSPETQRIIQHINVVVRAWANPVASG